MWERFSYYGMRALLIFYMTKEFLFGDNAAYGIYGAYTALVYATPLFGGMIADRILGYRKAVVAGGILMALGHFTMAFQNVQVFYFALGLLICGNGFFKPNISTIVGKLYKDGDPRRDSGFTIFYMGINIGAMAAPLLCGLIGETYGWHYGFGLAGIGMVVGLIVFLRGQKYLGGVAEPPNPAELKKPIMPGINQELSVYIGTGVAVLVAWQLVQATKIVGGALSFIGVAALAFIVFYMISKCNKEERDRLVVVLLLCLFSMVFWAFFEQAGSSINLFTDRNVDRSFFGWEIPASVFQSVNPAFILIFAPIFATIWTKLGDRQPSTPVKFGLAILQLGLGFGALWMGAKLSAETGMVPLFWLVAGYMLHTTGELCLSPVGLSAVTKLSPARIGGLMMGTWFLATAFSQYIAGLIAMLTGVSGEGAVETGMIPPATETVMVYGTVFGQICIAAIVVSVLIIAFSPIIKKGMHGTK